MLLPGGAGILIFWGHDILAWISVAGADRAYRPMVILSIGFVLAAAVSVPYTLSVASGLTRIPLIVNLAAVTLYVPLTYALVKAFGIIGGAYAWALLNGYYLFVMVPLLQPTLPMNTIPLWFFRNVAPFIVSALVIVGGTQLLLARIVHVGTAPRLFTATASCVLYGFFAAVFIDSNLRSQIRKWITSHVKYQEASL